MGCVFFVVLLLCFVNEIVILVCVMFYVGEFVEFILFKFGEGIVCVGVIYVYVLDYLCGLLFNYDFSWMVGGFGVSKFVVGDFVVLDVF